MLNFKKMFESLRRARCTGVRGKHICFDSPSPRPPNIGMRVRNLQTFASEHVGACRDRKIDEAAKETAVWLQSVLFAHAYFL